MARQIDKQRSFLKSIINGDLTKRAALTTHQQITVRIFDQGRDANNSPIGRYTKPYIKRRVKKGLGANPRVILQFTGQMRNTWQVIEEGGEIGSGFINPASADKSFWVEDTYGKDIFKATSQEEKLFRDILERETNAVINTI